MNISINIKMLYTVTLASMLSLSTYQLFQYVKYKMTDLTVLTQ